MKPWGEVKWLLSKLPKSESEVFVLGACAAEARCRAVPSLAFERGASKVRLLDIEDPTSRFTPIIRDKIQENGRLLRQEGQSPEIYPLQLFADDEEISSCLLDPAFLPAPPSAEIELWLDISSLPKRFFFLLTKLAVRDDRIATLIVTYAQPAPGRYTEEHLAEDPSDVQPLPGFGPLYGDPERLIVSVGFETLGLPQLLGEYRDRKREIGILIPFPPGQPYSRRVWETVRSIGHPGEANVRRISALDAFGAYEQLFADSEGDAPRLNPPALAPYGPKPISLGMCLYAIEFGSPVYYTQPRVYHPDYSLGIGSIWAYCIKLRGRQTWTWPA